MKYLSIGWISMISLCSVTSFPDDTDIWKREPLNLKQLLDLCYMMSNTGSVGNPSYTACLWEMAGALYPYRKIQKILHQFLATTIRLRRLLVYNGVIDGVPPCRDEAAIAQLFYVIVEMEDVLNDLLDIIEEWEREIEGTNMVPKLFSPGEHEWFQKNGFEEEELKSITIKRLKVAICDIYGEDKPLNSLLKYYGAAEFHQPQPRFSSRLASLVLFSISKDAHSILERHVTRANSGKPHSLAIELLEALKALSSQESPIWFLNGEGRHQGMFTWYLELYKYGLFEEIYGSLYMEMITTTCQTVEEELAQLAESMMQDEKQYTVYLSEEPVFILGHNIADYRRHFDKLMELIKEDGPITKLCQAVRNYTGYTNTPLPTIDSTINHNPAKRMRLLHMKSVKDPVNEFSNVAV